MRHGFLLIDKPPGPTSHDIVAQVRRSLPERDIGHLGTLDPQASGLLVLAVGKKALKVIELFAGLHKEYIADITLGAVSSTYDRDGVIDEEGGPKVGWEVPEEGTVRRIIMDHFLGKVTQVPPAHSAIKISGQRAYRKARQGLDIKMPERQVEIDACDVLKFEYPHLQLRVACGSGTYIRSIAHDLGQLLRCGGYLSALRRTKVGEWSVDDASAPDAAAWANVMPLKDVLAHFPKREITAQEYQDLQHGKELEGGVMVSLTNHDTLIAWYLDLPVAILEQGKQGLHGRKVW